MSDAELLKHDTRARERLLRQGAITPEQVRAYLDSLPELADKCDVLAMEQPAVLRSDSERHSTPAMARTVDPVARVIQPAVEVECDDEDVLASEPDGAPDSEPHDTDQPSADERLDAERESP
jgi:hypothetical protein